VDGRLTLNDWWPGLVGGGPWRQQFRERRDAGVAIADLRRERDSRGEGELAVEFLSGGDRDGAEAVLEEWARWTGYRRIWFEDRMVDLGEQAPAPQTASAICPTCGASWDDSIPEFWASVRDNGCFPRTCPLCGGELPQWEVVARDECFLDPGEPAREPGELIEWPKSLG
jgi:hypothetical protein